MSDLTAAFNQAVADALVLPVPPGHSTLLRIYALYKQAKAGDVNGEPPDLDDLVACAKWDAWSAQAGKDADAALRQYIELIDSLKA